MIPPGSSTLLGAILLAIAVADTVNDLAHWWEQHKPALRLLSPGELAIAVAAKDRAKAGFMPQNDTSP